MTGDRRWPDDSPEEDAEVHRAAELAKLDQWMREQKTRPLADALKADGALPGGGEVLRSTLILPAWWHDVAEPHDQCWACQRPGVASPCGECRTAREQATDQAAETIAWSTWAALTAARRRLLLAARWRRDPWTGRPVSITIDRTEVDSDGNAAPTGRHPFHPVTPSTAWDRRGELR